MLTTHIHVHVHAACTCSFKMVKRKRVSIIMHTNLQCVINKFFVVLYKYHNKIKFNTLLVLKWRILFWYMYIAEMELAINQKLSEPAQTSYIHV